MTDQEMAQAVERALEATSAVPDELRSVAFAVVLSRLLRGETPARTTVAASGRREAADLPLGSLPEFIAGVRPKKHPQFIVSFAYYYLRSVDERGITTKEIEDSYRQIRQKAPRNFSDTIAACQRRGWLIPAPEPKDGSKAWIITMGGETYVERGFQTS